MKKKLIAFLLVFAMIFAMAACGSSSSTTTSDSSSDSSSSDSTSTETYNLKFSFEGSEGMRQIQVWLEWEEKITEATDGRVTFTNYFDSTLLDANSEIEQLTAGIADIGDVHRYSSDGFVLSEKWKGFTLGTSEEAQIELTKTLLSEFSDLSDEFSRFKYLGIAFDGGTYELLTVSKGVESVEDMKGLVIWCEADFNDFFEALGATPVNTPWSEVYSSLQKNMYDGLFIAAEALDGNSFAEVCNYVTMVDLNYLGAPGHLMNLDTWNSLPADIQAVFEDEELVAWLEETMAESARTSNADAIEWSQSEMGTTIISLDEATRQEFVDILNESKQSIVDEWDAAGLPGSELLARMLELNAEYE